MPRHAAADSCRATPRRSAALSRCCSAARGRARPLRVAAALSLAPQPAANRLRLLSGSAHLPLAEEIAAYVGVPLTSVLRKRFADGECYVQILDSVRGCDVFIIQPTCSPVADNLMEVRQRSAPLRRRQLTAACVHLR